MTVAAFLTLSVAISRGSNAAPHSIQAAVREYIDANMPWPPGTARVDFLSASGESATVLQNRADTFRIEPAGNSDFIGDMVFLVRFFKDGSAVKTESVRTKIEVARNVVVAARALPVGSILTGADIRTAQKWVRRIHPQALASVEETSGKMLTVQVSEGAELFTSMLKDVPLVKKGKMVKIVFDNGLMRIATVGLPEEDGIAGSIVRVRNITSNKIIYARVLGDSVVGIEY